MEAVLIAVIGLLLGGSAVYLYLQNAQRSAEATKEKEVSALREEVAKLSTAKQMLEQAHDEQLKSAENKYADFEKKIAES